MAFKILDIRVTSSHYKNLRRYKFDINRIKRKKKLRCSFETTVSHPCISIVSIGHFLFTECWVMLFSKSGKKKKIKNVTLV